MPSAVSSSFSTPSAIELSEFLACVAPTSPARPAAAELYRVLSTIASREAPLLDVATWSESLLRWVVEPRSSVPLRNATRQEDPRTGRLRTLAYVFTKFPPFAEHAAGVLATLLDGASVHRLLVAIGLSQDRGLLSELGTRVTRRALPVPPEPEELAWLLNRVFRSEGSREWLARVPVEAVRAVFSPLLGVGGRGLFAPLDRGVREAVALLCARAAANGVADAVIDRSREVPLGESPYLALGPAAVGALEGDPEAGEQFDRVVQRCRGVNALVVDQLEEQGVTMELVFRLEVLERSLRRVEQLVLLGAGAGDRILAGRRLLAQCLRDASREQSVRDLFKGTSARLARKVVERTGAHGERRITRTRRDYLRLMLSGAGGGALTAFTCVATAAIASLAMPLMFQGAFRTLNFVASFALLQVLGFTLASMQPSITAAALAGSLARRERDYERTAELVARIARSQVAAVIGNVGAVVPMAWLLDLVFRAWSGESILSAAAAEATVGSLDPRGPAVFVFAALTGLFLWVAGLASGWVENWVVYRRIAAGLGHLRGLQLVLGRALSLRVGAAVARLAGPVGASVVLGLLLGASPVLGVFIGLPLETRHVTLQTGGLALAISALGAGAPGLGFAVLGIGCVMLLNFGVSFALSLVVALRARRVPSAERGRLARAILRRLRADPLSFVLPPRRPRKTARGPAIH